MWWQEIFLAILALREGSPLVTDAFPKRLVSAIYVDVIFHVRLNIRLNNQWNFRWLGAPCLSLWRHCNAKLHHTFVLIPADGWSLDMWHRPLVTTSGSTSYVILVSVTRITYEPEIFAEKFRHICMTHKGAFIFLFYGFLGIHVIYFRYHVHGNFISAEPIARLPRCWWSNIGKIDRQQTTPRQKNK